jgi:endonuclease-3
MKGAGIPCRTGERSFMNNQEKVAIILKRLKKEYAGQPRTALEFSTSFELLVATILSAQTTDVQVNKVTPGLFRKYRSIEAFAQTAPDKLAQDIRSVNFYNNKAKSIQRAASMLMEKFGGEVPRTMEELVSLPGVARKTANIVLHSAFGIEEGIAVDTHVKRLAFLLGLTKHTDPDKIEQDLMAATPKKEWGNLSHLLIYHGRAVCQARKPMHDQCVLADICPSAKRK